MESGTARRKKKVTTENEISAGMTRRLPQLKPHKIIETQPTFSKLRKKLSKKEDIDTAGIPNAVPDYDMTEKDVVPQIGIDDRLFTEVDDDVNDKIVPSDMAVSGRLYTN
jgi:hypothetical protein